MNRVLPDLTVYQQAVIQSSRKFESNGPQTLLHTQITWGILFMKMQISKYQVRVRAQDSGTLNKSSSGVDNQSSKDLAFTLQSLLIISHTINPLFRPHVSSLVLWSLSCHWGCKQIGRLEKPNFSQ